MCSKIVTKLCNTLQHFTRFTKTTQLYINNTQNSTQPHKTTLQFTNLHITIQHIYNTIHNYTQRYKTKHFTKQYNTLHKSTHLHTNSTIFDRTRTQPYNIAHNFTTLYTCLQNFVQFFLQNLYATSQNITILYTTLQHFTNSTKLFNT